jgi:hypothetical protein
VWGGPLAPRGLRVWGAWDNNTTRPDLLVNAFNECTAKLAVPGS